MLGYRNVSIIERQTRKLWAFLGFVDLPYTLQCLLNFSERMRKSNMCRYKKKHLRVLGPSVRRMEGDVCNNNLQQHACQVKDMSPRGIS